jgi:hypothetical protein
MGMLSMARRNPKDLLGYLIAVIIGLFAAKLAPTPNSGAYIYILVSYHVFLAWVVLLSEENTGLAMPIGTTILTHAACVFLIVAITLGRRYVPFFGFVRFGIAAIAGFEHNWLFTVSRGPVVDDGPIDLLKSRMDRGLYQPPPPSMQIPTAQMAAGAVSATVAPHSSGIPQYQPLVNLTQPVLEADLPKVTPVAVDTSIAKSIRRKPSVEAAKVTPILNATGQDHEDWLRERASQNPAHRKPGITVREEYEEWLKARYRNRAPQNGTKAKA